MPKYDSELAKAEIEGNIIIIRHHLRQAELNKDKETLDFLVSRISYLLKGAKDGFERVRKGQKK